MRTFTDNATPPRTWLLEINVAAIKRVRANCHVDLLKLHEGEPSVGDKLAEDPIATADVLFQLVEPQAREQAVSHDDFDACLSGESLGNAIQKFWEESTDFFQGLARGAGLPLETIPTEKTSTPGNSSISSPESSASTQTPSHSES